MYNEYNMPTEKSKQDNQELQKTESQQISTTEEPKFKPTNKMIKWMLTTFELGFEASQTEISEKSGVSRDAWYKWSNIPAFVEWWDSQWQQILKQNRWKLDAIGLKQAKDKYSYWKDMMNRTGNIIPEAGVQTQVNTQINLPNANLERITR